MSNRRVRLTRFRLGPWAWPADRADWPAAAADIGVPFPTSWGVLLPTVVDGSDAHGGALLVAETGRAAMPSPPGSPVAWSDGAKAAWTAARQAVPGALTLLWTRLADVAEPAVRPLHAPGDLARVDGASLGLPLALLLAAEVSGLQLPADLAATGAIRSDGRVEPVAGLAEKIEVIQRSAPHVRRLFVPAAQLAESQALAERSGGALAVWGVASVREAVGLALGAAIEAAFDALGDAARTRTVDGLLKLALDPHGDRACWPAVAAAARRASRQWPELSEADRSALTFAEAVAARHVPEGVAPPPSLVPDAAILARLPIDVRTLMRAHLVQQSADRGVPDPEVAEALAAGHARTGHEAWPAQVRLTGALGRLRAATGRPEAGLALALSAAATWAERGEAGDLSFPLCEVYRLAGALDDGDAFARAEAWRTEHRHAMHPASWPFLALARGQASVLRAAAGHAPAPDAVADLRGLCTAGEQVDRLGGTAARWVLRLHLLRDEAPDTRLRALVDAKPIQAALHTLDVALHAQDPDGIAKAMAHLAALRDQVQALGGLIDAGLTPEAIARLYPY